MLFWHTKHKSGFRKSCYTVQAFVSFTNFTLSEVTEDFTSPRVQSLLHKYTCSFLVISSASCVALLI